MEAFGGIECVGVLVALAVVWQTIAAEPFDRDFDKPWRNLALWFLLPPIAWVNEAPKDARCKLTLLPILGVQCLVKLFKGGSIDFFKRVQRPKGVPILVIVSQIINQCGNIGLCKDR